MWSVVKSVALSLLFAWLLPVTQAAASPSDLLAAGRVDDAIASLQAQLKSSPNDAASYHYLCRAYFALANWDRAISACEKSVTLASDNSDYHLWLGRAYGEKADHVNPFSAAGLAGKVRREFERAVQLNPKNVEARADLAEFYLDAPGIVGGGQDKARTQAAALSSLSQAKAHYVNGRIAEKNRDQGIAEKEYRAAIQDSQGNANDWLNLALFYKHINRLENMEQALDEAANARTAQNEVLVECAEILLRTDRDAGTAAQFVRRYIASNSATEKSPMFKAHYVLGTALERQGDKRGAAQEYNAALALASGFSSARQALQRVSR
jgi:tetratricopeptide (TPR) repeat protein